MPTLEQLRVADQQGVKLRLGRLTTRGQKGVDARIVRDLIILSRNRAISTAYLMSGDEDVREGVVEAQEFGVSVVLLGIEPVPGQYNQAATLVREADDVITLSRPDCTKFLTRAGADEQERLQASFAVTVPEGASPSEYGRASGAVVRKTLDPEAVSRILGDRPRIPKTIDVWLVKESAARFEDPLKEATKHAVRAGFWDGLASVADEGNGGESENVPNPE